MSNFIENVIEKLIRDGMVTESELQERIEQAKKESPLQNNLESLGMVSGSIMNVLEGFGNAMSMQMAMLESMGNAVSMLMMQNQQLQEELNQLKGGE